MSVFAYPWLEEQSPRDLARWVAAGAIVLVVHVAAVAYLLSWHQPEEVGDASDIVTVELAPIDSTPDATASDVAPAQENMIESQTAPQPEQEKPTRDVKVEQLPEESQATVATPLPKVPDEVKATLPPAPRTAQQVKGGAPRIDASWQTLLVRQLQRAKRYPPAAQGRGEQGVVMLSFSLDRKGHVLAHRIAQSSGHADLDDEVMAMIMRAEPLPPFPDSMPQARLDLTVPVRFSLH